MTLHEDFVVDPRPEDAWDENSYVLETNPVTGEQTLFIKADYSDTTLDLGESETGRQRFVRLLRAADAGTRVVADNGFGQAGTYTMVPRNAAFVVILDDLVDPSTLNAASVRVQVGDPAVTPFEARVFLDPNHGDNVTVAGASSPQFFSTRLVIDPAISELDSFNSSTPISVNLLGFPASVDSNEANVEVRFPTQQVIGQIQPVLQNLSNSPLTTAQNGSFDFSSSAREVVRAFRAGGRTDVTGDPGNGFLFDDTAPRVVGTRAAVITNSPVILDADNLVFNLPEVRFPTTVCDIDPRAGDLIAQPPFFARVRNEPALSSQGIASNLEVELIVTPEDFTGAEQYVASGQGPIAYRTAYDAVEDAALAFCFVETTPQAPDSDDPTVNLSTDVEFTVRFNEAVDPGLLEAYEGIALLRKDPDLAGAGGAATILPTDYVPGTVTNNASLETFTFRPFQNLAHLFGNDESYFFQLQGGDFGPRDLAGNPVVAVPGVVEYTLDMNRPDQLTGGRVIRFTSPDEEWPFGNPAGTFLDGLPRNEWFGNVDYDIVRGRIRPRSVVRSQVVVSQDPENTLVSQMFNGTGTSLPLNPLGARVQFVWRYLDVNLPLHTNRDIRNRVDMSSLDLDVERILLNPLGSTPVFESFPEFSVSMSHSSRTPNEIVNALQQLTDPGSGLTSDYDGNQL
ncbi:MAG: Ig-like domain-containing protein, partial [Longimicrobiales bacterium]|nr:Ig-like domain-containing protein [Longimicrobiales bacterium]